ncbi:Glycosyl transferase family 2 [uncultured archaeon]|nr:Glycosyl transferase family 2 [uncultured archaeon]
MYSSKDISVVIVTYNRPEEIKVALEGLKNQKSKPYEVLVVDQSENPETKKETEKYKKFIPRLRYLRSEIPSIAIAKNKGLKKTSKTKIVLFLDDDAALGPDYMDEIVQAYNTLDANGIFGFYDVGGYENSLLKESGFKLKEKIKSLFLLGNCNDSSFRITSPYGNTSTFKIRKPVKAEWFPGTDPSYKKEVFKDLEFDENFFGWSLGEDVDISYRIHKKYNGLYAIPASVSHHHPQREWTIERKIKAIYMNQINHLYLFYKDMPEMRIRFTWNLVGISLYRFLSLFNLKNSKNNYIEFEHYLRSLAYCIKNKEKIKSGDLSIPFK